MKFKRVIVNHNLKKEGIMRKKTIDLLLCVILLFGLMVTGSAQEKTIVFVSRPEKIDVATGEHSDKPFIDDLEALGFKVVTFYNTALGSASQATLDTLDNADLVIIGRSSASNDFQPPNREAWNAITAPVLLLQLWAARSSRLNWFNCDECLHFNEFEGLYATILVADDPVFAGQYTGDLLWCTNQYDVLNTQSPGNGECLVVGDDNTVQFVRFQAGVEFYSGSVDMPAGPRTFIGNGNDNVKIDPDLPDLVYNYYNFSDPAKQIYLNEVKLMAGVSLSAIEKSRTDGIPRAYSLDQNYPNPFNPTTTIMYGLPKTSLVEIVVYDASGHLVETLIDQKQEAGIHYVQWNASGYPSGFYIYRIQADDFSQANKCMLIK
jgi:hypothetical protein